MRFRDTRLISATAARMVLLARRFEIRRKQVPLAVHACYVLAHRPAELLAYLKEQLATYRYLRVYSMQALGQLLTAAVAFHVLPMAEDAADSPSICD